MAESSGLNRVRMGNNVYTTLLVIALVALVLAAGYLWYRDSQLSGSVNPFKLEQGSPNAMVVGSTAWA